MNTKILNIVILMTFCFTFHLYAKTKTTVLPYYKLTVGKNLIYDAYSESKGINFTSGSKTQTQFLVLEKNPDSSFRIIVNRKTSGYQIYQDTIRKEAESQVIWAFFDIFPDGRIIDNVSLENLLPASYFIPLPTDTLTARLGWQRFDSSSQERTHYIIENKNLLDSIWMFGITKETPFDSIYLLSSKSTIYFDIKKGLVTDKENEATQGYGYSAGKTTGMVKLDSIKPLDTIRLKPFINELISYFQVVSAYDRILNKVENNSSDANSLMESAKSILDQALTTTNDSTIKSLLNDKISSHEQIKNSITEDSIWLAKTIDKKAVAWKLKDLNEKIHSLKQYKGKVVILDFWYRGCPWCIRAMPMINQIAESFKNSPVAVLGMNVDKNKDDALFVVDKMKLIYPSLQAAGIDKKYGVTGFPTLFVIDKRGIIRDVHIGYSPDLGVKVTKKIESLLEKK
jgi:thiol-disulfide isomerase/thioredoxin